MSTTDRPGRLLDERLCELAEASRILAMEGHGLMTLGHMSLRDPEGRGVWIKRGGVSLAELFRPEDFVLIDYDGMILAGTGQRHAEWPIHTEIYRARSEIQAVAHTYPRHGCLIGATAAPIAAVTREACYFEGRVARYNFTSNLISTSELGRGLAEALGPHYAILMHNQGVTFCGRSIAECTVVGVILERVCKSIVALSVSGLEWSPAREAERMQPPLGVIPEHETARFWNYYRRKLARKAGRVPGGLVERNARNVLP